MRTAADPLEGRLGPKGTGVLLSALLWALTACHGSEDRAALYRLLPPTATGVRFVNELPEDSAFNILNYVYYYNGGGVAVGDIDNDDLPDLYFTSNVGRDRLYRNVGNYAFEDVTEQAGVGGAGGWTSGVTMADVNGDGHIDIYVSSVSYLSMQGRNAFYLNQGDGTFRDMTDAFGLQHVGYSTQATFFDYDGDGDLDMFLLNNSTHTEQWVSSWGTRRSVRHPRAGDRLFRNDGARFIDVSEEAGIFGGVEGYGLGVIASDLNLDGCPDLFVANDFQESDFLYFNNCDGTFTESIATALGHTSRFSMGVDAADFTNDGRPDLIVLDMLPEHEQILKTSSNAEHFIVYDTKVKAGYGHQYARNTLQINRGQGRFSDIGYLAGVFATDWSWAPLFADLDNDGYKDLFVTTGIYRRPNDLDYISYLSRDAVQASLSKEIGADILNRLHARMPQVPIPNYAYRNNGDLTFTNMADAWGVGQPGFSNGAAYVDLNNSGALDLVVNNINAPAAIYRNRARERNGYHYLKVRLHGAGANTAGIGAKVVVRHDGAMQMLEQMPTRGFQSSVDPHLHFGLGHSTNVDSLIVVWPDDRREVRKNVAADQSVSVFQDNATSTHDLDERPPSPMFATVATTIGIDFTHEENAFYDYSREPLIPHRISTEGPALAVGDVNGDHLDDIYVGGAKNQGGRLFVQRPDGSFRSPGESPFKEDSLHEDVDAAFFDADADGHLDLYVVSGGNEFSGQHEALRDRLYVNDGEGGFHRADDCLPPFFENGSTVAPGDFNGDGYLDLFIGGRVVAGRYGELPRSYLLENDGTGRFRDVTMEKARGLSSTGMVSSAVWVDYDGDGQLDLIVVGEWMPIRVFRQEEGLFEDRSAAAGFSLTNGWWNVVTMVDLRGNGRPDLVLGNLGLNSYIRASPTEPARLYVDDFDHNGTLEHLLTFYKNGVSYPLAGRDEFVRQMPHLRDRYRSYADFGASRLEEILPASELRKATVLQAHSFASAVALNNGDGTFDLRPLPVEAQFAPIFAALSADYDRDGHTDVLVAGNFHGVTPVRGRYDASYGLLLRGDGAGHLEAVDVTTSNLVLEGEVRAVKFARHAEGDRLIVVARNDASLQIVRALR